MTAYELLILYNAIQIISIELGGYTDYTLPTHSSAFPKPVYKKSNFVFKWVKSHFFIHIIVWLTIQDD